MATFRFHTRVPATPDQVWAVLSDVDRIPDWFPGVDRAEFDGRVRVLSLSDGGTLRAAVVTDDPVLRRFQYSFLDGMPVPIAFHLGTLDVIEDGVGSLVVYSQQVQPDELGAVIGPAVGAAIDGIRRYFVRDAAAVSVAAGRPPGAGRPG